MSFFLVGGIRFLQPPQVLRPLFQLGSGLPIRCPFRHWDYPRPDGINWARDMKADRFRGWPAEDGCPAGPEIAIYLSLEHEALDYREIGYKYA